MRRAVRIAVGSVALAMGIAAAAPANAQVRFEGSFPLPHARVSVGVGFPFAIGTFLPLGYDVYLDPDYGYGFVYQERWIPCRLAGSRWVVIGSPVFYRAVGPYRGYRYGFERRGFRNDRGFTREGRASRGSERVRSSRDSRGEGHRNQQSRGRDRRSSR